MNKKYQFFISSTYEDLKEERQKAIQAVLTMNQIPIGMEMFNAADEEQWEMIRETIDSSDYYIIIVGMKYGSVIPYGSDAGISYTEKEYNYAIEKGIPVLAFICNGRVDVENIEKDPDKLIRLNKFKEKIKEKRHVNFWKNADDLVAKISQTIGKQVCKGNRPGWVRTTDFDIEKSYSEVIRLTEQIHKLEVLNADFRKRDSRAPQLRIEPCLDLMAEENGLSNNTIRISEDVVHFTVVPVNMSDVNDVLVYKDSMGQNVYVEENEVRLFRFVCQNGFPLAFRLCNSGTARATGVRVHCKFPNELLVLSSEELLEYITPNVIRFAPDAYENWDARFWMPSSEKYSLTANIQEEKFIGIDELIAVNDIAELLDPAEVDEGIRIFSGEAYFELDEVKHKDNCYLGGPYIIPMQAGQFEIECDMICNEYADEVTQKIEVVID